MKTLVAVCTFSLALLLCTTGHTSDHADPLEINMLRAPNDPGGRITDLFAFFDSDQDPTVGEPGSLVVILCVSPSIEPIGEKPPRLDLKPYTYRISIDLNPKLAFDREADLLRYGGTVLDPEGIAADATLEFRLDRDGSVRKQKFTGLNKDAAKGVEVVGGIFDDPFISPRFFRHNVVAVIARIPLRCFPANQREFLLWATTSRGGRQIDHVGRSQRTQLPRFDYLNTLPPDEHVPAIQRHRERPPLLWDLPRTALPPLLGSRPFDAAPDVMILNRDRPTGFPNGRILTDDVAAILAATGDAQLWEASFTDDPRYPRATMNDGDFVEDSDTGEIVEISRKPFRSAFPYLAAPWTDEEVAQYPLPFDPPARPNLTTGSWRKLALLEGFTIMVLAGLLFLALRSRVVRVILVLVVLVALWKLGGVYAANSDVHGQAAEKLSRILAGLGLIVVLAFAFAYVLGRRHGARHADEEEPFPPGNQGLDLEDRQYEGSRFSEIREAVMADPYYRVWGAANERPLPIYEQSVRFLLRGIWWYWRAFPFLQAARRTVRSHADLRWGTDGKGVRRLLHPNGICLTGVWKIDGTPQGQEKPYTGYFAPDSEGLVIARYSTGAFSPLGGKLRSLALVGKLYPTMDRDHRELLYPATFITQEDIAGNVTQSIREAELTNSPNVTPTRRGLKPLGLLVTALTLARADEKTSERQLYEIAELGKTSGGTNCPRFMRLRVESDTPQVGGDGVDFRDEILGILCDRGEPGFKRSLVFGIEVSDEGERSGKLTQRVTGQKWSRIGSLTFTEAAASYNGDFVIHFHHPPWRTDRNDPGSVERPGLRSR